MGEQKYEKALVNVYDIETSKTIQAAADASFRAIFSQLNTSEAEVYKTCGEQLKRLVTLQRDLDSTQEQLRLAKAELARIRLEEAKKESDANDSVVGEWGGY